MKPRAVLVALCGCAIACGTTMMMMDGGSEGGPNGDASAEAEGGGYVDTGIADTGQDVFADCGTVDIDDAGICDPVSKCSADMPGDAAGCWAELDGACSDTYILLVRCERKYTVCNPATCKTDPIKTGTSLQQNCANQQMAYQACKN